jgi:HSP20 family protein
MAKADSTSMARNMSRWVDHVLGGAVHKYRGGEAWAPSVNLYEDAGHYCVIVDLAGMDPDDIDLRIEEGALVLSGRRSMPEMPECSGSMRVHLMEIDHGPFSRKVELPDNVDADAAAKQDALYQNGYLRVRLPKR